MAADRTMLVDTVPWKVYRELRTMIELRREENDRPKHQRAIEIAGLIENAEEKGAEIRGSFFAAGPDVYFFDGSTQRIFRILDGTRLTPEAASLFASRYSLLQSDKLTDMVVDALVGFARAAPNRDVRRFAYYDQAKNVLYLSRYNGFVWKLDGEDITSIPNGKEVFFLDDDGGSPSGTELEDIAAHGLLEPTLVADLSFVPETDGGLTGEQQKLLFFLWCFMPPFAELVPTKPILVLEGSKGSGKTTAVKRLQAVIHGRPNPLMLNPGERGLEDFYVALQRNPIALVDNVDTYVKWFPSTVAAYVQGNQLIKRTLYTDSQSHAIDARAFLAVTTRNPVSLYQDDVVQRSVILRMAPREGIGYVPDNILFRRIAEHRRKLYGEFLYVVNQVVGLIPKLFTDDTVATQRLSDFVVLAQAVGKTLGFSPIVVAETFETLEKERAEFMIEADPFVDLLSMFIDSPRYTPEELTAKQLHERFAAMAQFDSKISYPCRSAKALGRILNARAAGLQRHFELQIKTGHRSTCTYQIARKVT